MYNKIMLKGIKQKQSDGTHMLNLIFGTPTIFDVIIGSGLFLYLISLIQIQESKNV